MPVHEHHAVRDTPARETAQLRRDVALSRNRQQRLAHRLLGEQRKDPARPVDVELGEGIIQQQQRRAAESLAKRFALEQPKRDGTFLCLFVVSSVKFFAGFQGKGKFVRSLFRFCA